MMTLDIGMIVCFAIPTVLFLCWLIAEFSGRKLLRIALGMTTIFLLLFGLYSGGRGQSVQAASDRLRIGTIIRTLDEGNIADARQLLTEFLAEKQGKQMASSKSSAGERER